LPWRWPRNQRALSQKLQPSWLSFRREHWQKATTMQRGQRGPQPMPQRLPRQKRYPEQGLPLTELTLMLPCCLHLHSTPELSHVLWRHRGNTGSQCKAHNLLHVVLPPCRSTCHLDMWYTQWLGNRCSNSLMGMLHNLQHQSQGCTCLARNSNTRYGLLDQALVDRCLPYTTRNHP
jgi:hypothetical protein